MHGKVKSLPKGCGYTGRDFGASYIDSECFGGRLYDLDNGESGILYEPSEYIACPSCRHEEWLEPVLERMSEEGWCAREAGEAREFPIDEDTVRFAGDFEAMRTAWLSGWDERDGEIKSKTEKQQ